MALSNPLRPEAARVPGCVGLPLPSVHVRIVCEDTGKEAAHVSGAHVGVRGGEKCRAERAGQDPQGRRGGIGCTRGHW